MGEIDPLTWTMAYSAGRRSAQSVVNGYSAQYVRSKIQEMHDICFENVRQRINIVFGDDAQTVWDAIFPDGIPECEVTIIKRNKNQPFFEEEELEKPTPPKDYEKTSWANENSIFSKIGKENMKNRGK